MVELTGCGIDRLSIAFDRLSSNAVGLMKSRASSARMGSATDQTGSHGDELSLAPGLGERFGKVCDLIGLRHIAAKELGVSIATVQRYVAGAVPPFDVCAKLCKKASVRMEWLAFASGPMHSPDAYVISGPENRSQSVIREPAAMDSGMHATAVRITEEVLGRYGLRDRLDFKQYSELTRLVYNDLVRGAAEDVALSSLDRILAITKNDMGKTRGK